jgi:large subunit ribosomal protein L35
MVAFKVVAQSGDLSDGELRLIPVLPGRMHLAQSRFVALKFIPEALSKDRHASERFKRTKSGKFKRHMAFSSHLMTGKSAKRRRRLRTATGLSHADTRRVKRLLPYG